jgi:Uri superfamily endonuclease
LAETAKIKTMTTQPGTYALVLVSQKNGPMCIGRLRTLELKTGYYVYAGSALGPGGLAARLRHHTRIAIRKHWHIDYLRPACELINIWFTLDPSGDEHAWANAVARLPGAGVPMRGFGSSDCGCETHLF